MIITRTMPAVMAAAMLLAGCGGQAHSPASDTAVAGAAGAGAAPLAAPVPAPQRECGQAGGVWLPPAAEDGMDAQAMCGSPPDACGDEPVRQSIDDAIDDLVQALGDYTVQIAETGDRMALDRGRGCSVKLTASAYRSSSVGIHMVVCVDDTGRAAYGTGPETAAALYETCRQTAGG